MIKVPLQTLLFSLSTFPFLAWGQEDALTAEILAPHQSATTQISQCLDIADSRIALLGERLGELKEKTQRLAVLETSLNEISQENESLQSQLAEGGKTSAELEGIRYHLAESQRTQSAYREEAERLRAQFTQHTNAIALLEDALSKVTRQKSLFEGQLVEREQQLAATGNLKRELDAATKGERAYRSETERLRKELTAFTRNLETADDALRGVTKQKSTLEAELITLRRDRDQTLADSTRRLEAEQKSREQAVAANAKLNDELAQLQKRLGELEEQRKLAQQSLTKEQTTLAELRGEKAKADANVGVLEEKLKQLPLAEGKSNRLKQELAEAQTRQSIQKDQLERLTAQLEQSETLAEAREQERLKLAEVGDELKIQRDALETALDEVSQAKAKADQDLADALAARDAAAGETNEAQAIQTQYLEQLARAQEEWKFTEQALTEAITDDQVAKAQIEDERDLLAKQLADARQRLQNANRGVDDQAQALADAQQKLIEAQDAQGVLTKERQRQLADLNAANAKAADWKKQVDDLQKRLKDAQSADQGRTDGLAQQLTAKDREQTRLKNQIAALTAKVKEQASLETQLATLRDQNKEQGKLAEELTALQAKAKVDQDALTQLQNEANAARQQAEALKAAQANGENEVQKTLADLQKQLADRDQEINAIKDGLTNKERAWEQTRITFQTEKQKMESELAAARKAKAAMQTDFLRIDPIRYELNSSQIDDEQARVLAQAKKIVSIYPDARFEISGHTCTIGSAEKNRTLSEQRALSLLNFLSASGIARQNMTSEGFGEDKPQFSNETDAGRRKNRRVEIRVKSADGRTILDTEGTSQAEVPAPTN